MGPASSPQAKGAKRQYMEVARSLKLYGYLVVRPAICDYPEPHTRAGAPGRASHARAGPGHLPG